MTSGRTQDAERALRKGDFPRAISLLEAALKKNPEDVKGRRQLADTYAKVGRFEDAVRELLAIGDAYALEGLRLKAMSAYKAALDIDPDHEPTKAALAALGDSRQGSGLAEVARRAEGAPPHHAPPLPDDHDVLSAEGIVDEILEADDVVEEVEDVEHVQDAEEAQAEVLLDDEDSAGALDAAEEDELSLDAEAADDLIVAEAMDGEDDEEIDRSTLPDMPLFADLPGHAFDELVSDLDGWRVPEGAVLVREGEIGHSCFVLVSGEVRVERGGEVLATLGAGDLFGEMALLSDSPRAASIVAATKCELFEIKRERLEDLMGRYPSVERVLHRFCRERLLANVVRARLFEGLDERLVREMIRAFRTKKVRIGQRLVAQGEKGKGLFVVLGGELDVSREQDGAIRTVSQLRPGDVFGEMSLLFQEPASATVMALQNGTLLALSRRGFDAFVRRHPVMKRRLEALAKERRASQSASAK